jgi:sporulation protein YlmC with PRC-barrel domain
MKVILTSMHIGRPVRSYQGVELGTVVDLVINEETATVSFAVLAAGEVEELGERLLIVPWQALSPDRERKGLRLGINKDRLKKAPALERSELDTLGDKQVRGWVLSYYGLVPSRLISPEEGRLLGRGESKAAERNGPDGEALARMLATATDVRGEHDAVDEDLEEPAAELDDEDLQEAA